MIKIDKTHLIHVVLGHSYLFYFVLFCIAIVLDIINPLRFIRSQYSLNIGVLLVVLGSLLLFWAQSSSKKSLHERHEEHRSEKAFLHGPYTFLRSPTQVSLLFMFVGLGLVLNSVFVTVAAVISFILSKTVFIKKQESILESRYGESYKAYKTKVPF